MQKVTKIVCDEAKATGVVVNDDCFMAADAVVSAIHPMRTLELLDTKLIRPAFRRRIHAMPQTVGGFSVYLEFKPGVVPYMNHNFYGYAGDTPWNCEHYTEETWPKGYLYMHFCHERAPKFAHRGNPGGGRKWVDAVTIMKLSSGERPSSCSMLWANSFPTSVKILCVIALRRL